MQETVLVIDFGGQYNQLIARRVRELGVYAEILPYNTTLDKILSYNPKGIIFTGGPKSVYADNAPKCDEKIFDSGVPILGICYGAQLLSLHFGGKVKKADTKEYGRADIEYDSSSKIFKGIEKNGVCWMSHTDYVDIPPNGFKVVAKTKSCPVAAFESEGNKKYGVQFHPESVLTPMGERIIQNWLERT